MSETIRVTADHIAEGERGNPCACPVALAVRDQTGAQIAYVDMATVAITRRNHDFEAHSPPQVSHFVDAFDHGHPVEPFEFTVTWQDGVGCLR